TGGGSVVNFVHTGNHSILLSWAVGLVNNTTYNVRVRAKVGGVFGNYGSSCQITTPSSAMMAYETTRTINMNEEESVIENPTTLSIYPNPNSGEQLNVNLEYLSPNSILTITDLYGKVILTKALNTDQLDYKVNVKFENKLSAGFYLVSISSDGKTITEKLIVR
ncbi:MAG: T9SS type A sorting domain-containing protein, partial [Flavobacteriales bacterium]